MRGIMAETIKQSLLQAIKTAMKAQNKQELQTLRFIHSTIKQKEIDERKELDDSEIMQILNKLLKQRRDSYQQYNDAGRDDLAQQESQEIELIKQFLPQQLSDEEIDQAIQQAISATKAQSMKDMGSVMGYLQETVAGKADMSHVSSKVKSALSEN